jgi:hypothetical protein
MQEMNEVELNMDELLESESGPTEVVEISAAAKARLTIMLDRAVARGEGMSFDAFLETIIDLGCDVKSQRWENSDKAKDRRLFSEALVKHNVLDPATGLPRPDKAQLFTHFVRKYHVGDASTKGANRQVIGRR